MTHSQAQDLLPGYALGALEVREREELEEHLQTCSACYQLAQEQVEVAAMLSARIADVAPPPDLKRRIEDSVAEESKPLESRMLRAEPSFLDRLGLTARWPALAASAAGVAAIGLMAVVLVYVVVSQGDLNSLRDENRALAVKVGAVSVSQAALTQLNLDNQALAVALDQQSVALSTSQGDLEKLREASLSLSSRFDAQSATLNEALGEQSTALSTSQGDLEKLGEANLTLSAKLDAQALVLAAAQGTLDSVQETNDSLPPTLGEQGQVLASSQQALSDLQGENRGLAAQLDEQSAALATAQQDLDGLRQDNQELAARITDQDVVLAASQSDIDDLATQNLALAATATNQQIFTYLQALPVTNKYVLKATADAPGTFGMLVTNVANNWGVAVLLGVDPLEPGTVYDLWLEKDGVATHGWFIKQVDPDSKFGQVYAKNFPTPVTEFDRLFVTLEPAGGSPAPTGPELLSGTIN